MIFRQSRDSLSGEGALAAQPHHFAIEQPAHGAVPVRPTAIHAEGVPPNV